MLDLALETRHEIYQQLIIHPKPINQWYSWKKPRALRGVQQNYLALSQTCRQFHDEVRCIFYWENVFSFDIFEWSDEESRSDPPNLRFLRFWRIISAPGANLVIPQIRHRRVSINPSDTIKGHYNQYTFGEMICKWLATAYRLRRLYIHYKTTSVGWRDEMSVVA